MSASHINVCVSLKTYHAIRHALGFAIEQGLQSSEAAISIDLNRDEFRAALDELQGFAPIVGT